MGADSFFFLHATYVQGELLISSQVTRSQASNLEDAIGRLQTLLDEAADSIKPIESDPKKVKQLAKRKAKVCLCQSDAVRLNTFTHIVSALTRSCRLLRNAWIRRRSTVTKRKLAEGSGKETGSFP